MTLYSIVFLITEFFFVYILYLFFDFFFEERRTSKAALFLTYLLFLIVADGEYLLFNSAILNLVLNLGFMFLITLHYEASYKKRIMMVFLLYILMAAIETFVLLLLGIPDIAEYRKEYREIFEPIVIKFIYFILILLLRNFKSMRKDIAVPIPYWLSAFGIPIGSVYLMYNIVAYGLGTFNKMQIAVSVALILLINIITFYLYDAIILYYNNQMRIELLRQENVYYSQQFESIKTHIDEVSAFRHDFRNHLEVLESLLDSDLEKARAYIASITGVLNAGKNYAKTGNIPIDSIINYKLARAQEDQIEVEMDLAIPEDLAVEPSDMVVILGNLLDNAINASLKIEQGRRIEFHMAYSRGILEISITNAYDGVVIYEKNRIKTTSGSERYHGYGLRNVEVALKKYHGYQRILHNDHEFCVSIIMYVPLTDASQK